MQKLAYILLNIKLASYQVRNNVLQVKPKHHHTPQPPVAIYEEMTWKQQSVRIPQNNHEASSHLEEVSFPVYANPNIRQPQDNYYACPRQLALTARRDLWYHDNGEANMRRKSHQINCCAISERELTSHPGSKTGSKTGLSLVEQRQKDKHRKTIRHIFNSQEKSYFINIWKKLHSSWKHLFRCMSFNNHILWGERDIQREKIKHYKPLTFH